MGCYAIVFALGVPRQGVMVKEKMVSWLGEVTIGGSRAVVGNVEGEKLGVEGFDEVEGKWIDDVGAVLVNRKDVD